MPTSTGWIGSLPSPFLLCAIVKLSTSIAMLLLLLINILIYVFYDCLSSNALSDLLSQCVDFFISYADSIGHFANHPYTFDVVDESNKKNFDYTDFRCLCAIHCMRSIRNMFLFLRLFLFFFIFPHSFYFFCHFSIE